MTVELDYFGDVTPEDIINVPETRMWHIHATILGEVQDGCFGGFDAATLQEAADEAADAYIEEWGTQHDFDYSPLHGEDGLIPWKLCDIDGCDGQCEWFSHADGCVHDDCEGECGGEDFTVVMHHRENELALEALVATMVPKIRVVGSGGTIELT